MTAIITQIKQIIEDEAEKYATSSYFHLEYSITGVTARECKKSYITGAELLLPMIEQLLIQRDWLVECSEGSRLEKIKQLNQELLNTLKEEK